jgi:hypothetical protein
MRSATGPRVRATLFNFPFPFLTLDELHVLFFFIFRKKDELTTCELRNPVVDK